MKGIFTLELYESVFGVLICWYFFSAAFIILFSLLYYRKFVSKWK